MINRPSESGTLYQLHTMSNRKDLQESGWQLKLNYFTITHNWHCCYINDLQKQIHHSSSYKKQKEGQLANWSSCAYFTHAARTRSRLAWHTHTPHSLPFLNHPVTLHIDYTQINGKKWLSITTSYQTHISKSTGKSVSVLRWISQRARSAVV